jgi:hypothetical protein
MSSIIEAFPSPKIEYLNIKTENNNFSIGHAILSEVIDNSDNISQI